MRHGCSSDAIQAAVDVALEQVLEQTLREHHDCLTRTSQYNQDKPFSFRAQQMEKSNRLFFGRWIPMGIVCRLNRFSYPMAL